MAKFIDQATLDLVDAASTQVTGVKATLNRPDLVGLSNYARRSVADVSVDLMDRVINDAAMTLGSRGLTSQTAKFSLLDLDKTVTIQAAGLFLTTIQSVTSATQANLAAQAPHAVTVQDRGAEVWKTDSRPGLEELLASLPNQDVESAEICFEPGVYDFTVGAQRAAIGLRNLRNLTFLGAGTGATVIRLMPNQTVAPGADADVIRTFGCRNLTFRELSVHGSYLTLGNASEQMHGIDITEGSTEIAVHRVRVFQSAGDGLRLLGSSGQKARKIWVEGCRFIQNKRSGVSFQRAAEFVSVRNCYIESTIPSTDQSLDFEPTGSGSPTDIIIESNVIVHQTGTAAVALSGISSTDATRRVTFAHNIVLGGEIFCTNVAELTIKKQHRARAGLESARGDPAEPSARRRVPAHHREPADQRTRRDTLGDPPRLERASGQPGAPGWQPLHHPVRARHQRQQQQPQQLRRRRHRAEHAGGRRLLHRRPARAVGYLCAERDLGPRQRHHRHGLRRMGHRHPDFRQ